MAYNNWKIKFIQESLFTKDLFILGVWGFCLNICLCTRCLLGVQRGQTRPSHPWNWSYGWWWGTMWVLNIEARSCACALSHQQALSHLSSSINVYVVIVGLLLFGTGLRSSLASNLVGIFLANPISYQNLLSTVKISVLQITHFWVTG